MLSKEEICHDLGAEALTQTWRHVGCWEVLLQFTRNSIQKFVTVLYQDDNAKVDGFVDADSAKTSYKVFRQEFARSVWVSIDKKAGALVDCLRSQFELTRLFSLSYTQHRKQQQQQARSFSSWFEFLIYVDGTCECTGIGQDQSLGANQSHIWPWSLQLQFTVPGRACSELGTFLISLPEATGLVILTSSAH